jgi:hypothetical protein
MAGEPDGRLEAKLDVLIRLQALSLVRDFATMKEKILFLSEAGFQPKAIADLLQTTSNHVNVALSTARRGKTKATG